MKPKLRFQGFHDDWEEKKLGDVAEKIQRGASPRPISDKKWFDSKSSIGWIRISDITRSGKYIYSVEQKLSTDGINKSRFLEANNLILSIAATIGKPVINKIPVCIHDGFIVFKNILSSNDIEFLYYYLLHIRPNWFRYQQPGSQFNLNSDLVRNQNAFLPSLPEQEKIGAFLSQLDDRIEKQEQKIALLKERKKGWMQQLFSQNIRFKDENGQDYPAWEEKKLGEVLEEQYKGKKSKESENGNLLLTTDYLDNREYSYVDELNNVNSKDILILWDGSQAGKVYTGYEGVLGSTFMKVSTYDYISSNYIYHFLNYNKKLIQEKWRTGSGIPHVSKDFISSFLISLPSLPEQEKIAEFLSKQDELIEKEEEKLSLLKEQKKGFLQQMFV